MTVFRKDGFQNIFSGLGAFGLDRTVMGSFRTNWATGLARFWTSRYSMIDMSEVYFSSGLAARIIDRPSDDAFQRGVVIEGDDDNIMADEFDRLAVLTRMADAIRWSRLFGGSVILLITKDGGDLDTPMNFDAIDEIIELRVYDLTCIKNPRRYYEDLTDPEHYGTIEYYELQPPGQESFYVHETRLITVSGEPIPVGTTMQGDLPFAGRPVLDGCLKDVMRYDQALEWTLRLLERKQQAVYGMTGLGEMFANGDDEIVTKRINMVDMVRGILNSVVIDKEDTYLVQNLGLDGIQPLLSEYQIAVASSSGIALMILFGQSKSVLANTAEGTLESYYSLVSKIQNVIARPPFEKLISILFLQKALKGKIPDEWKLIFNPLWMPSAEEKARTEKSESEANKNKIDALTALMSNGILTPDEVRRIVVNEIYNEYGFSDASPSTGGDLDYAEGVDTSMLDAPGANA